MRARMPAQAPEPSLLVRFTPLFAGLLGVMLAAVGAIVHGMPLPLDVAGVFAIVGLATTWIARATPVRGALFVLVLAAIVVGIVYGG